MFAVSRHVVSLVSHFKTPGWYTECSCGWKGPTRESVTGAHRDFDLHKNAVDRGDEPI